MIKFRQDDRSLAYAFIYELSHSLRLEHERPRSVAKSPITRSPLAVPGRHRQANKMKALAIGPAGDHVHILISLPSTLSVAKALQLLKGNSSKWIRETFPTLRSFAW